jgi:hypothetical protein
MMNIPLKDILINARQESVQMRHYYLGVEHLFIAMLQIQGGLTCGILEEQGFTANYIMNAIRRRIERGTQQRLWAGYPYTPRMEVILEVARNLALDTESSEITERELLNAVFQEKDSLPIRVLKSLGLNIDQLAETARTYTLMKLPQLPNIIVSFGKDFESQGDIKREQLFVLRRMFPDYTRIRVERRLTGFREALILVVTPVDADGRDQAPVVAKIDLVDTIMEEFHRYEAHVKHALPLRTARLEGTPTIPDASDLAGLKYTLVPLSGTSPRDLRTHLQVEGAHRLGDMLRKELFGKFGPTWWGQKKPYRFQTWSEYDWLLPPVLILNYAPEKENPTNVHMLSPFNRARARTKLKEIQFNDTVVLEHFTVQKIDTHSGVVKLATGFGSEADKHALKVEVRGIDLARTPLYSGKPVEQITGIVWKTRHEILTDAARSLDPKFTLTGRQIPFGKHFLPNPLLAYDEMLDRYVTGSMSKIHGDFHLGNILVGPDESAWLIDFAHTRDGHTLFDWATLEVSLLGDAIMPQVGDSWEDAFLIARYLAALESPEQIPELSSELRSSLAAVAVIREIAHDCLTVADNWFEYFIALTFCALRATTWETMSLGGRRLMFLLSAMAMMELNRKLSVDSAAGTPLLEDNDLTDQHLTPVSAEQRDDPDVALLQSETPPPRKRPKATRKLDDIHLDDAEADKSTELYKPPSDPNQPPSS